MSDSSGQLQSFTIDQAAGALALSLGAIGSLLLVVWQSRCLCRCRIGCSDTCYLFDCAREPPKEEIAAEKQDEILEKEGEILIKEDKILKKSVRRSPRLLVASQKAAAKEESDSEAEDEALPEPEFAPISSSWKKL